MAQEKWEYITEFVWASVETQGVKEYLRKKWPNFQPNKFSPETMILELNNRGEKGWELVHMEPIPSVGKNGDVGFATNTAGGAVWSSVYFCVFKRRISD